MSPDEIRIKLGLQPFPEFLKERHREMWHEAKRTSGYDARKREHTRKYRWKPNSPACQKCVQKDLCARLGFRITVEVRRHARWCSKRGECHVARKQYVRARKEEARFIQEGRWTGRTTEMLLKFLSACSEGKRCAFIVHSQFYGHQILRRMREYTERAGIPVSNSKQFDVLIWRYPAYGSSYDALFLDHFVRESFSKDVKDFPRLTKQWYGYQAYVEG